LSVPDNPWYKTERKINWKEMTEEFKS